MRRYKADVGYISPPRGIPTRELGEFEAASNDAALAKAHELAKEHDAQGTVVVRAV